MSKRIPTTINLIGLTIFSILLFSGCSEIEIEPDYSEFLLLDHPTFRGNIDGEEILWNFGVFKFQMISGHQAPNYHDPTDFSRYTLFGLVSDDNSRRVMFYSPMFDISNPDWHKLLFEKGETRAMGAFGKAFSLVVTQGDTKFETSALAHGELEVLKVEEVTNGFSQSLRVWMRLRTKLEGPHIVTLKGGLMIAEFLDYKNYK